MGQDLELEALRLVRADKGLLLWVDLDNPTPEEARALLAVAPGVELLENFEANRFPMPTDVTGRDPV